MRPVVLSLIFFTFLASSCLAQVQEKNYSTVILNFARTIQWPTNSVKDRFVVGVIEYEPLENELRSMVSVAKINGKSIEVRKISSPMEARNCQIIFLPAFKSKMLLPLLSAIQNAPILVVTNKLEMAKKGSGINFLLLNGKLRYEINSKAIEGRGIRVPASIKSLGIEVNGG